MGCFDSSHTAQRCRPSCPGTTPSNTRPTPVTAYWRRGRGPEVCHRTARQRRSRSSTRPTDCDGWAVLPRARRTSRLARYTVAEVGLDATLPGDHDYLCRSRYERKVAGSRQVPRSRRGVDLAGARGRHPPRHRARPRRGEDPQDAEFFEGRDAYFADPEGNYWEVAWAAEDKPVTAAARRAAGIATDIQSE